MKMLLFFIVVFTPLFSFTQSNWHPYAGIHLSMDGGAYFLGPSIQIGTDYTYNKYVYRNHQNYPYKRQFIFSAYLHCFLDKNAIKSDTGPIDNGKYSSFTLAGLVQKHISKNEQQGWFLAGGLAVQRTSATHQSTLYDDRLKRIIVVAAMRTGYTFPLKKNEFTIEINAIGPHSSTIHQPPYSDDHVLEILTQLSLGVRYIL